MAGKRSPWEKASQNVGIIIALLSALGATRGLNTAQVRALIERVEKGLAAVKAQLAVVESLNEPIEDPTAGKGA